MLLTRPSRLDPPTQNANFSELYKPGIVDGVVDASKGRRRKNCVRRSKLRMIEKIEKLSTELEGHPLGQTEGCSLEYGEIEIDDTLLTQAGIHARLVSELEIIRLGETGSVEPLIQSGLSTAG